MATEDDRRRLRQLLVYEGLDLLLTLRQLALDVGGQAEQVDVEMEGQHGRHLLVRSPGGALQWQIRRSAAVEGVMLLSQLQSLFDERIQILPFESFAAATLADEPGKGDVVIGRQRTEEQLAILTRLHRHMPPSRRFPSGPPHR
ncbi:hypothetical protein [Sphaerochaeta globosa]|uniref:hypothetical protein n=1 Tax=Sphaerochaeta globosa TaxID=1131703 RepID=UPI00155A626E|nr:hypothetical protein [Sphaerochaeta globosa]